jgi:hypothetical protein
VAIKSSDLSIIKKVIKPAKKSSSNKEGFVGGMMGGFKEGLVTYNSGGSNNTDKDEGGEAMVCTEYYDTDPEASKFGVNVDGTSAKKTGIDWSKIKSWKPYFVWGSILLLLILGFFLIKDGVPKIFAKLNKSSDVISAPEAELEIPEVGN